MSLSTDEKLDVLIKSMTLLADNEVDEEVAQEKKERKIWETEQPSTTPTATPAVFLPRILWTTVAPGTGPPLLPQPPIFQPGPPRLQPVERDYV